MIHEENSQWLWLAYMQAQKSPDPSTQVGAIIIDVNKKIVLSAYNAPVSIGVESFVPKALQMEHAERKAIYSAAKVGLALNGCTMIAPWASCADCARAIVASGIRKVVRHADLMDHTPLRWRQSIMAGNYILEAGKVEIIEIVGKLDSPTIRFDGMVWAP